MNRSNLNQYTWKQHGLGFGVVIYVFNAFVIPLFSEQEITIVSVLMYIPICIIAGYAFGRYMKWKLEKKEK